MSHMYTTPRSVVSRIPEHLESLKSEFESLAHDVNMYKMQRDDYERKLQAQMGELTNIQQTLYDLERNHTKSKQQYEEQIMRLTRQLEQTTGQPQNYNRPPQPAIPAPRAPKPNTGAEKPGGPFPSYGTGLAPIDPNRNSFSSPSGNKSGRKRAATEEFLPSASTPLPVASASLPPPTIPPIGTIPEVPVKQLKAEKKKENGIKSEAPERKEDAPDASGVDWIVGYNPGVSTNFNIGLMHNLEHSSVVCCVKFSNDGKSLATGCNRSAQIFDVETGEKIHCFSEDEANHGDLYIRSVCFSPDNKLLAAGAEDKTVKVWDIERKSLRGKFVGHELDIYSLDFSKCGNLIVSGSGDKKARIWDVEKGECLYILGNDEVGPKDGVTSVAFSPDGRLVAAGSLDRIVRLWDAQTGYFLERYEGHLDSVYSVAFSPDGKSLASGSLDKTLKLWDLSGSRNRSRCRSTFSGHKDFVLSVAFSPDGNWLISGSKDRSVQFWDPRSAVTHMMLQGHKNSVISVAVSPAGGVFSTGSGDFRARIWKYD